MKLQDIQRKKADETIPVTARIQQRYVDKIKKNNIDLKKLIEESLDELGL